MEQQEFLQEQRQVNIVDQFKDSAPAPSLF